MKAPIDLRRCCEPGCANTQVRGSYAGNGWYHVSIGFMRHACPDHADAWRKEDEDNDRFWRTYNDVYQRCDELIEALMDAWYPTRPSRPSQSSIDFDIEEA